MIKYITTSKHLIVKMFCTLISYKNEPSVDEEIENLIPENYTRKSWSILLFIDTDTM